MNLLTSLITFSILIQLGVWGAAQAQELKKIRIGYPSLSFRQSNVWVAKEEGLFRKYGLEVEPIFFRGGQVATQALVGGDPPIVNIGTVIQASLRGHSLALIAAVETNYDQIVFARPGITRVEQLKGKKFGVSGFGSATHYASTILVKHMNIDAKELTLLPSGPDAERLAALSTGKIDATFFSSSAAPTARKMGFVELVNIADLGVEVQGNGFATSRAYIQSNRDTVKAALKGFVEAIYFIYANKTEAQRFLPNTCAPTIAMFSKTPTTAISKRFRRNLTPPLKASSSCSKCWRLRCPKPRTPNPSSLSI